jgi:hypothetical protein
MGYTFPDAREALYELIPKATDPAPTPYFQLVIDWEKSLGTSPAVLIYRSGGEQSGPFRSDRMGVDVYAEGSGVANDVAQAICAFLTDGPQDTTAGLLDQIEAEVVPTEIPYTSDTVNLVSATYRVATRAT